MEAWSAPCSMPVLWTPTGYVTRLTAADESTLLGRPGRRLDHIFVTSSLQPFVADSYIVDNEMVQVASDHRPVVTEFDFTAGDDAANGAGAGAVRGVDGHLAFSSTPEMGRSY